MILVQQSLIPHYRVPVFEGLRHRFGERIQFVCGARMPDGNETDPRVWSWARRLRNIGLAFGLVWQIGIVAPGLASDLLVCELNLRMPSTWLVLVMRFVMRRPTIGWGHARGRSRLSAPLRWFLFRMVSGFIAYTVTQKQVLQREFPRLRIVSAHNACMRRSDCFATETSAHALTDVIYVGRLHPRKKVNLLLAAFMEADRRGWLPPHSRLVIVGKGPEMDRLGASGREYLANGRLLLLGEVTNVEELRRHYASALLSVSPGYAGLSVTQSLGFGVPIAIARNEPHSPEIEACTEGRNSVFFPSDNPLALAEILRDQFAGVNIWAGRRNEIAREVADSYSYERMIASIGGLIDEVGRGSGG